MATQSGVFTFDEARATLTQGADGVWLGETRHPVPSRLPSGLAGTFDGRIDNSDELLRRLGSPSSDGADDAHLALAIFERWGVDGLRRILGDWGRAGWGTDERTLHVAGGIMGARSLSYCLDTRYAAWASGRAGRITRAGRTAALSGRFAAGFMSLHLSPDSTPYEEVRAVPPRVCVSISTGGRVTPRRFWTLEAGEVRYPGSRMYEEQLHGLWREAGPSRASTARTWEGG